MKSKNNEYKLKTKKSLLYLYIEYEKIYNIGY